MIGSTPMSRAASAVITTPPQVPASGVLNSRPAAGGMIRVSSVRVVNGVATNDIARRGRSAVSNSNDCHIGRLPGTVDAQANEVADATSWVARAASSK